MNKSQEDENALKMEFVVDYINQNFMKTNFSIMGMADDFSVSPSWLSHYFKKHMHPVSYTHLDVYKRQVQENSFLYCFFCIREVFCMYKNYVY